MPESTRSSELRDILKVYGFFVLNDKSQDKHVRKKALDNTVNKLEALIASKVEEARVYTLERLILVCANCQRMTNFMEVDLRNFKNGLCGNCGADALKADFQSIRSEIEALQSKKGDRDRL